MTVSRIAAVSRPAMLDTVPCGGIWDSGDREVHAVRRMPRVSTNAMRRAIERL
jgi:hypothetical protein